MFSHSFMKVKVCGIRYIDQLEQLASINIDYIGINFYRPSKRYVNDADFSNICRNWTSTVKKVGIFVNEEFSKINEIADEFALDFIQLHGDEDPDFCQKINDNYPVIKVFHISEESDFLSTNAFSDLDMFLFDTKSRQYGGSGKKFDWDMIKFYENDVPFLLSGGITPNDTAIILRMQHHHLIGVDINSGFEISPGQKDIASIEHFVSDLKSEKSV